jgi:hypothetical protein
MKSFVRALARLIAWPVVLLAVVWAAGALAFDLPWPALRRASAIAFALAALLILWRVPGAWRKLATLAAASAGVAAWWFTLPPSHHRHWQPDVAHLARAEINGDLITLHNVRNFDYQSATDYTPRWETRTLNLSQLTGADIAINYWGSPWMAHPIISFQFANAAPVCFSIETRKEVGEKYSAIGGLYRRFELTYVAADERDVLRLRTSFRKNEDVYLYRLTLTPEQARRRFMDYIRALNHLHDRPYWYNALTTNCTTTIRTQTAETRRQPWDWRLLVNGKGDEMMYERGQIVTADLPFPELKRRARVNEAGRAATTSPDFSRLIREGRPGF